MRRRDFLRVSGGLFAAPLALAQSGAARPRIALVDASVRSADIDSRHAYWAALLDELAKLGHVEGRTAVLDRWGGSGDIDGYSALARKIAESAPQVVVVRGRPMLLHLAAATKSTPIVVVGAIPPDLRLSIARPGKNVTGIQPGGNDQLVYAKQLEFLKELIKADARVAWFGPKNLWDSITGEATRLGARQLKLSLQPVIVDTPVNEAAIRRAFDQLAKGTFDAVLVSPSAEIVPYVRILAELLASKRLPSVGTTRLSAEAGLTLCYGADLPAIYRQIAHYVDKILKGAKPGDLPIEQPTKFELVVNMKTARRIGVVIPPSVHMRADRMIE